MESTVRPRRSNSRRSADCRPLSTVFRRISNSRHDLRIGSCAELRTRGFRVDSGLDRRDPEDRTVPSARGMPIEDLHSQKLETVVTGTPEDSSPFHLGISK